MTNRVWYKFKSILDHIEGKKGSFFFDGRLPVQAGICKREQLEFAKGNAGRHVFETTEPGTSKTCTNCGFWNAELKLADKIFDCPRCQIRVDRQLAGARNNFFASYGLAVGIGWDGRGG